MQRCKETQPLTERKNQQPETGSDMKVRISSKDFTAAAVHCLCQIGNGEHEHMNKEECGPVRHKI